MILSEFLIIPVTWLNIPYFLNRIVGEYLGGLGDLAKYSQLYNFKEDLDKDF